ncbi:MAG: LacI family DNA-binding transcriptional regulator, partial [Phycisphaerae bacterium]|nr:LacI family DNA-binding transcriptional regulator [Phycisphaerae bacterium]
AGIGLVTAHKALQRAETEGWAQREDGARRLRVTPHAPRLARSCFAPEPPTLTYWVLLSERRLQAEFRLPGLSEGLHEALAFSSSRYLFLDAAAKTHDIEAIVAEQVRGADAAYLLLSLPARWKRVFERLGVPCVVIGDVEPSIHLPNVYVDQRRAGLVAGGLLCRSGRVVTLCGEQLVGGESKLLAGVCDATRLLEQPEPDADAFYTLLPSDAAALTERIDRLLAAPDRPHGILATRTEFAMATLAVAARRGLRIPRDLQLVGLGHHPLFEFCYPRVSSIGVPSDQELGRRCAELLSRVLLTGTKEASTIEIDLSVIERESTLPRKR